MVFLNGHGSSFKYYIPLRFIILAYVIRMEGRADYALLQAASVSIIHIFPYFYSHDEMEVTLKFDRHFNHQILFRIFSFTII